MSFHSNKRWEQFSGDVQMLRLLVTVWFEGILLRRVTQYKGSDSIIYEPDKWSKYKIVPYDRQSMPPLERLTEGVLLCVDVETWNEAQRVGFRGDVNWHPGVLPYEVGSGARTYRVVPITVESSSEEKRVQLSELTRIVHQIEGLHEDV